MIITESAAATEQLISRRSLLHASLATAAVVATGGCSLLTERCRFALTCTVEVGRRSFSGRSVVEIASAPELIKIGDGPSRHTAVIGEALVVDLPTSPLFVTLDVPGPAGTLPVAIVEAFLGHVTGPDDFGEKLNRLAQRASHGRTATIRTEDLPRLVLFRNLADPSSVEEITSYVARTSSIEPAIGRINLKCEVTGERVSHQLKKYIPWVFGMSDGQFQPNHGPYDWSLAATMTAHAFVGR